MNTNYKIKLDVWVRICSSKIDGRDDAKYCVSMTMILWILLVVNITEYNV